MVFMFSDDVGKESFCIKGEDFKYLVKVRRHVVGDKIGFRSPTDTKLLYSYEIVSIENRSLCVKMVGHEEKELKAKKEFHIGWCIIDTKSIEKVLPSLCEMGVSKISFISCERSQRNFKLDFKRFERILHSSMQQSGRSDFMEFDTFKNIQDFIKKYPHAKVFDFCEKTLSDYDDVDTVLVGCEGGFSDSEREFLKEYDVFAFATPMVLRSQSAVVAVASKVLL
jgi:16S rRNA (uracil1498-N3)-methyltransferase